MTNKSIHIIYKCLPPVTVRVANSYSATLKPALLWAVTLKWYQTAGSRSSKIKFWPGFTLLDTWIHSELVLELIKQFMGMITSSEQKTYFFLCSITKYNIGHPPSDHLAKCKVMLFDLTSINSSALGITGFSPLVFVFKLSEGSPVPMLENSQTKYN